MKEPSTTIPTSGLENGAFEFIYSWEGLLFTIIIILLLTGLKNKNKSAQK